MQQQNDNAHAFFASRLRELRGKRSQAQMAKFLEIKSQQAYANYEKGRFPSPDILNVMAQKLGVTVESLTIQQQAPQRYQQQRAEMYEKLFREAASKMTLKSLVEQIEAFLSEPSIDDENRLGACQILLNEAAQRLKLLSQTTTTEEP